MNEREARELLSGRINQLRLVPYRTLLELLDKPESADVVHSSGRRYQVETQVFWDDKRGGDLRVTVSIDDGGPRAWHPLIGDFIKSPTDEFVGE